jgi:hypothetical protein
MVSQPRYRPALGQHSGENTDCLKVFFAELVALLHREGKTATIFLQELYDRYVVSKAVSFIDFTVTRYGYFQVSLPFSENRYYILSSLFRPTTAISSATTRLSLTGSSHGLEIMTCR